MASNPKFCGICDQRHITKPSTDWCSECNQALCIECKDFHALSNASQNHSTIVISNHLALDTSLSQVEGHCSVHDDKYVLFCQTHDCLLCLTCLEEHMKCGDVVRISKLIKDVKISESFVDTQKSLSDILLNLSKIQSHLEENVCDIQKQKESVLQEILQIREQIETHLDQIENSLKTELDKLVDAHCNKNIGNTLKEIQIEKTEMEKLQQQMEDLNKYGSDLQAFSGLRKSSSKMGTTYNYLQTIGANGSLDKVTISYKMNRKFSTFIEEVKNLGSLHVQKIPSKIVLERSKNKQAQLVGVRKISINDIKLKLEHTFKVADCVTGCCFLPDGKFVLCERSYKNYVKILDQHGKLMFEMSMTPCYAFDVTCIDDNTIAVSSDSPQQKQINIIDVDTRARRSIPTPDLCYGITHTEGSLLCCVPNKGIRSVDTQNEKSTTIAPCDLEPLLYVVSTENKLYHTGSKYHTITCCDMKGNVIWTFKDENVLKDPRGIAVDHAGNVYTVSSSQHKLFVLSADGLQSRQLLSKDHGLKNPCALAYDQTKHRLCVVNLQNNGFLFDITF